MNVADLNPNDKPSSENPATPEQLSRKIDQVTKARKAKIRAAATSGESFDSLEREVHKMIFAIGRQAVDLFVCLPGDGDLGKELVAEDGVTLLRSPEKAKTAI